MNASSPVPAVAAAIGAVLVLVGGWWLCMPGCFSIDEATMLLSARSFAQGHGVEVWNGFEETGSLALSPGWLKPVGGRLVSQYPDFFLLLSLPAFRALGLRGLMLTNLLAFAGVAWLTWRLAATHLGRGAAALALGLLAFGSFAPEYAVGAWPHMTAALAVLAPLALLDGVLGAARSRRAVARSALAGLLGGIGVGIRLDVAFGLAALAAVLLVARPLRWRELLAFGAGAVPPLAALALLNGVKFGNPTPFTYGPSYGIAAGAGVFLPLAVAAIAIALGLGGSLGRGDGGTTSFRRRALVATAALLVVMSIPALRRATADAVEGTAQLVLDLRLRGAGHPDAEPGRERGDAVRHFGELKKALLQSCPWLVLAAAPAALALRRRGDDARRLLWVAVPGAYLLAYGAFAWDGGLALNQRYFVPALPPLALLGAAGLEQLRRGAGWRLRTVTGAAALAAATSYVVAARLAGREALEERLLLDLPLALAGVAALGRLAVGRTGNGTGARRFALAAAAVAAGFAAFSCQLWDLPRTLERRARHAAAGERVRAELRGGEALLMSEPTVALASAVDATSRARLANPSHDFYRSFGALLDFHLAAGHRILLSVPAERYAALVDAGLERAYAVREVAGAAVPMIEITRRGAARAPAAE